MTEYSISKTLTANDTGETGTHQSGIAIPKQENILSFFPSLEKSRLNPRAEIQFMDESGKLWNFNFIYYNNRFWGGTRNEYRLTRMTKYIQETGLLAGDDICFFKNTDNGYFLSYKRSNEWNTSKSESVANIITLAPNWKIINV